MEKIKQALERARDSRSSGRDQRDYIYKAENKNKPKVISKITYTKTKTVTISKEKLREKRVVSGDEHNSISGQYKVLRTQLLQRMKANKWNSLAITGPNEGCGKTLTSVNLAINLAREVNHTVLLVDLDLRRPSIRNYFFEKEQPGISEYLDNNMELSKILFNPGIERLVVLPGNKSYSNSSEMLSSPKMVKLIEELKSRYSNRLIIFDMPPLLLCDDMIAFSPYIDAIMMVVEEGATRKDDLKKAYELINNSNLIGTVLNKSKEKKAAYEAYY
jgi:capsular exopolysaccharide synthesis family protein